VIDQIVVALQAAKASPPPDPLLVYALLLSPVVGLAASAVIITLAAHNRSPVLIERAATSAALSLSSLGWAALAGQVLWHYSLAPEVQLILFLVAALLPTLTQISFLVLYLWFRLHRREVEKEVLPTTNSGSPPTVA
jgi:hypothetical protein